jgi:hypothetical protein
MKRLLLLALVCGMFASGCAHNYVLTMANGSQVTAASKPKLKNGFYYFKDVRGRQMSVAEGRVREVAPASMAKKQQPGFTVPPAK